MSIRLNLDETGRNVEGATDNVVFAYSKYNRSNGSSLDVGDVFFAFESATDVDEKGKLKPGKKIKFAGMKDGADFPEKAKKNRGADAPASTDPGERERPEPAVLPPGKDKKTDAAERELAARQMLAQQQLEEQQAAAAQPRTGANEPVIRGEEASGRPSVAAGTEVERTPAGPLQRREAGQEQQAGEQAPALPPARSAYHDDSLRSAIRLLSTEARVELNALVPPLTLSDSDGLMPAWARPLDPGGLDRLLAAMVSFHAGTGVGPAVGGEDRLDRVQDLTVQLAPAV